MDKLLLRYIDLIISSDQISDEEILEVLIKDDFDESILLDVILFLPIAFTHGYFSEKEIVFLDKYKTYSEGVLIRSESFTDNKIYLKSLKLYQKSIKGYMGQQSLFKILARSSDFNVIIKALEDKVEYKNMRFKPTEFHY